MTASHGWRLLNTFYRYEVNLVRVWSEWEVPIISYTVGYDWNNVDGAWRMDLPIELNDTSDEKEEEDEDEGCEVEDETEMSDSDSES